MKLPRIKHLKGDVKQVDLVGSQTLKTSTTVQVNTLHNTILMLSLLMHTLGTLESVFIELRTIIGIAEPYASIVKYADMIR